MSARPILIAAACALGAACATLPAGPPPPSAPDAGPGGSARMGTTAIDLGDWRRGSDAAVLSRFSRSVERRYGAGLSLTQVQADMRSSAFTCAPVRERRGDPPDVACRKIERAAGCTYTWQVHLFDDVGQGRLARTRALYDKQCAADDGLLGGPG